VLRTVDLRARAIGDRGQAPVGIDGLEVEVAERLRTSIELELDPNELDRGADDENGNEADDRAEDVLPQSPASQRPCAS
jgi:hypothetical protein